MNNESVAQPKKDKANFIPDEALRDSEDLRNPNNINRELSPTLVSKNSPEGDQYTEEHVSPDQPTIGEAKHEVPDTRVKGG